MRQQKRILITGAGSGIGLETAIQLSREGHEVLAGIRNGKKFHAHWNERSPGTQIPFTIVPLDVNKPRQIKTEIGKLLRQAPVDTLINNAGYGLYGCFEELDAQSFEDQFQTNLFGLLNVTRAILPSMRERAKGQIVNISSILGRIVLPTGSAYCSSKWAVSGFSRSLRYEMAPFGVQVCNVEPGLIRTAFKSNMQVPSLENIQGPYAGYNRMIAREIKEYGKLSTGAQTAARKLVKLIGRRTLPASFRIGADAKLVYAITRLLPESLQDVLFRFGTARTLARWQS